LGLQPAEVPASLVAALRDRFDLGLHKSDSQLAHGDEVRVRMGPFTDLAGTIESVGPNERIWVLLNGLGRTTRVSLHGTDVQKS